MGFSLFRLKMHHESVQDDTKIVFKGAHVDGPSTSSQKGRPGAGNLDPKVIPFGPTKSLRILNKSSTANFGHLGKGQLHQKVASGEVRKNRTNLNAFAVDFRYLFW